MDKFSYKEWYAKNKERLSEERKQRYHNDPEYKDKVRQQAKAYRENIPPKPRKKTDKMTIPLLCEAANCSPHTFRHYIQLEWIPKGHVKYTAYHVNLLAEFNAKVIETRYIRQDRMAVLQPHIDKIKSLWVTQP